MTTTIVTAIIASLVGVVGAFVALRRDRREAHAQGTAEARETINLLNEQITITKTHHTEREAEYRSLEERWRRREEKLDARIGDLERDYRSLVLTVTTMGLCANAPLCPNYDAGDRRRSAEKPAAELSRKDEVPDPRGS